MGSTTDIYYITLDANVSKENARNLTYRSHARQINIETCRRISDLCEKLKETHDAEDVQVYRPTNCATLSKFGSHIVMPATAPSNVRRYTPRSLAFDLATYDLEELAAPILPYESTREVFISQDPSERPQIFIVLLSGVARGSSSSALVVQARPW
ncbi:hypothetical protein CYLTODRAFT_490445 [Cylindrobasidium torrendii FP15055 ss-10]|uniref:Uncharacterized protein n=1 Tax=Cylindrobasidium torrendii FP15055 ss-10 TaxID=1314674 RepID=A0A0D7BBT2_9AGAR|nr:hypothetical protein CYLTODRAFT_490445 [Cylindrobasidium torrendii FP15055 ss-10]